MTSSDRLRLCRHGFELVLAPAAGGSIARFDRLDRFGARYPILRGSDDPHARVLDMGSFPLVPYCNRIRDGRFRFRGRIIVIQPNMNGDPSPLHGDGWLAPWQVEWSDEDEAELSFRHAPGEWPWAYEARQHFRLDETGLAISLACRNLSNEPMPCGLGQHPYYPCTPATELHTQVSDVWTVDERVLPVERRPASGRYELAHRRICGQDLDNGFAGWSGEAVIATPGAPFALHLRSRLARFFQLYSPAQGGFFVAEPVSHANAALNEPEELWHELGLQILDPMEEMTLDCRFTIVP